MKKLSTHRWIGITATALAALLAVVVVIVSRDGNGTPVQQGGYYYPYYEPHYARAGYTGHAY